MLSRLFKTAYRVYYWVFYRLAQLVAMAICEPKLRVGRRRHDNVCDRCDEPCGSYAHEKLDFPIEDLKPDASTSRKKLHAMLNAEYRRFCLGCGTALKRQQQQETSMSERLNK